MVRLILIHAYTLTVIMEIRDCNSFSIMQNVSIKQSMFGTRRYCGPVSVHPHDCNAQSVFLSTYIPDEAHSVLKTENAKQVVLIRPGQHSMQKSYSPLADI